MDAKRTDVTLRGLEKRDWPFLEEIICKTWQYERFCSPKTARKLARLYLASCLSNQTFLRVAQVDGTPAGVIMGKDCRVHRAPVRYQLQQAAAALSLLSSREGRMVARAFSCIEQVDRALLKDAGREYAGELAFFVVDETKRGLGIGVQLFQALLAYMDAQGIARFYLYTDSSCNFGFYERQGLRRCGQRQYKVPLSIQNEMEFYLYEYAGAE